MNYHLIRTDDMLNGDGLRVILFVSGCEHHCEGCHNPETWPLDSGKPFNEQALQDIMSELNKDYISGITLSGGDPLNYENLPDIFDLVKFVKEHCPDKTIWLYTGYELDISDFVNANVGWDNSSLKNHILRMCDVVCDGKFIKSLADVNCPWVGSANQRVIDVKRTLEANKITELS